MVTASPAIAAAAEYRWIASDLIKQPPAVIGARTVPLFGPGIEIIFDAICNIRQKCRHVV
jgi:hypothetical protein